MIGREFGRVRPRLRRIDVKRFCASLAIVAIATLGGWVLVTPANAAPPTVTPSPGYDARLQEQRARWNHYEAVTRPDKPMPRRHVKRIHDRALKCRTC
jgi:hypothetical protein